MISAIMACDQNGGIGFQNTLPWPHIKNDMQMFAAMTKGNIVVMGYATFISIGRTPLPNRFNIVLVEKGHVIETMYRSCLFLDIDDFSKIIKCKSQTSSPIKKEIFVIGGEHTLNTLFEDIDVIHLTKIHDEFLCDKFIDLEYIKNNFTLQNRGQDCFENSVEYHFELYTRNM